MTSTTFFRACLALPLVIPALAWAVLPGMGPAILVLSLVVAGLPYLLFASFLAWKLGRIPASEDVPGPIVFAPVTFLPFEFVAFFAWSVYQQGLDVPLVVTSVFTFLPIAIFVLVFGYAYIGMTVLMFEGFKRLRWIRPAAA